MVDPLPDRRTFRRVVIVLVVGVLIAFSGCSGLDEGVTGDPTDTETTASELTTAESSTEPTTDAGETTTANDSSETTTGDGHGHSHSHDAETTAGDSDETTDDSGETNATADRSGKMTVVVAGTELPLDELAGDEVSIADDDAHTWRTSSNLTLARALASFDVDASAERLTYDGTTYREATDGTSINVRVNGESVDPQSYTLRDGDQVWVTVETAETDYSVPGEYIPPHQQHVHGPVTFVVEGEEIDFSAERFQSGHDRHFHFEGGDADPWHAHSWSVTLQYAFGTLPGIEIGNGAVTYNETTYRASDADTNASITVNGDPVDPSEYLLKDGDEVRIVVERNAS